MADRFSRVLLAVVVVLGTVGVVRLQRPAAPADATARAVTAAEAFLATLDQAQRLKANIDLNEKTRTVWSNLPTGIDDAGRRDGAERPEARRHDAGAGEGRARAGRRDAEPRRLPEGDGDRRSRSGARDASAPTRAPAQRIRFGRARVLRRDSRQAVGDRPVDAAVRRPSSRHQRHARRTAERAGADAHGRAAGELQRRRAGRSVRSATRTTRRSRSINALDAEQQKQAILGSRSATSCSGPAPTAR